MTRKQDIDMIELEVEGRFPGRENVTQILFIKAGTTVRELLSLLDLTELCTEIIIVYNGSSVTADDSLDINGTVIILPVICGG